MKTQYIITFGLLICSISGVAQGAKEPAVQTDTLKEFNYQYKGQPFPYDSGVSISDRQYAFVFRQGAFTDLGLRLKEAIKPIPKTIYVNVPVRKKGDGKKTIWFLVGTAAGIALGVAGITAFK